MDIQEQIDLINSRLDSVIKSVTQMQKNQTPVTAKADASSNKIPQIDANTEGVASATDGLFDIAESVSNDSDGLFELAELIAELDARVTALEEKEDE